VSSVVDVLVVGNIFSKNVGFPLPIIIPPILNTHLSPEGGKIGLFEAAG
jgi:hypothetical protein